MGPISDARPGVVRLREGVKMASDLGKSANPPLFDAALSFEGAIAHTPWLQGESHYVRLRLAMAAGSETKLRVCLVTKPTVGDWGHLVERRQSSSLDVQVPVAGRVVADWTCPVPVRNVPYRFKFLLCLPNDSSSLLLGVQARIEAVDVPD